MDGSITARPPVSRGALVCIALTACLGTATGTHADEPPNPHPTSRFVVSHPTLPATDLQWRKPIEATLRGPEVHRYTLRLERGQFAALRIPQLDGNVAAVVFDPDDALVAVVDENGQGQAEVATIVASKAGTYAVQVAVFEWDTPAVRYAIEWRVREPARTAPEQRAAQLFRAWYDGSGPGAALVVQRAGRTVLADASGVIDAELGTKLTLHTPVDLASVSKQFTGFAIALLADRRQLSLDDDVRRFIPELPDYGTKITLRHLLEHTSGVRDWDGLFGLTGRRIEDGIGLDEALGMLSRQTALNFAPGSRQEYSNSGYVLLALVVERVTGQPFDAWMAHDVLQPLGLRECRLQRQPAGTGRAQGPRSYAAVVPVPRVASSGSMHLLGSSALECSANDLTSWLANYTSGQLGGAGVKALVSPPAEPAADAPPRYVFGNWYSIRDGIEVIGHQGLAAGFRTSVHRFPQRDLAVIFLANDGNDATYPRVQAIENLFLGIAPAAAEAPDVNYLPEPAAPLDAAVVAEYTGRYESNELPAVYAIESTANGIVARHERAGTIPLRPNGRDEFVAGATFLQGLSFTRDAQGRVTGFFVHSEDVHALGFRRVSGSAAPVDGH